MASPEQGFAALNEPSLFDRVERLAFNALPAALTADMWTHVYVQQALTLTLILTLSLTLAPNVHLPGSAAAIAASYPGGPREPKAKPDPKIKPKVEG